MSGKKLGLSALIALVIGSMIGGGVFSLPQNLAYSASSGALLIGWGITAVGMICLALIFQMLNKRRPELEGGIYSYARAGFGDFIGFQAAWGYWFSAWLGNVSYAVLLFSALSFFFPVFGLGNNWQSILGASLVLWSVHLLVLIGVQEAALINTILTVVKVLVLLVFITAAVVAFRLDIFSADFWGRMIVVDHAHPALFAQVKSTMLVTTWVFIGIEGATVVSTRAAKRADIGKATVLGLVGCLAIYLLVSLLSMGVLDQAALGGLKNPSMAGVLEHIVGAWGAKFVAAGVILSVAGALLAWTLFAAELPFVAAKDGMFPVIFAKKNASNSPMVALWITNSLIQLFLLLTLFYSAGYQALFSIATAAILPPYLLSAAYGLKLAWQGTGYRPDEHRGADILLGLVGTLYGLWLCYAAGGQMLLSSLLFVPGIVVYAWHKKSQGATRVFLRCETTLAALLVLVAVLTLGLIFTGKLSLLN
ncbi:basic amino acid/polyamine antiporter [Acerihabitans sp. TG2]|uniref:basic amino acid/polyamine antiporter n=1 Tax=Acerihabitans sp. TG2 TaxID=3096008 RepID=UPI002B239D06|nr:basic amino acid/polyamine antiporter [Acerihabitans sp. TG2]MEA9391934.1 basic amino acid/polyamine antiporter [Acerihabitans sp. TG2]